MGLTNEQTVKLNELVEKAEALKKSIEAIDDNTDLEVLNKSLGELETVEDGIEALLKSADDDADDEGGDEGGDDDEGGDEDGGDDDEEMKKSLEAIGVTGDMADELVLASREFGALRKSVEQGSAALAAQNEGIQAQIDALAEGQKLLLKSVQAISGAISKLGSLPRSSAAPAGTLGAGTMQKSLNDGEGKATKAQVRDALMKSVRAGEIEHTWLGRHATGEELPDSVKAVLATHGVEV